MSDSQGAPNGAGNPANTLSSSAQNVADAAKSPLLEPAPDAHVSAAFALGWQMAELYRPDPPSRVRPPARDDLPGLGSLDDAEREQVAVNRIEAALVKLTGVVGAAGLTMPDPDLIRDCFAAGQGEAARRYAVRDLHVELLSTLSVADFRLGKAYGLGRALADTCRNPVSAETLLAEFRAHRIARLRSWLDDLASALPPHAAHSVSTSLHRWTAGLARSGEDTSLRYLRRQGELWRSLLSGEKAGSDMLEVRNYLDAASGMLRTTRRIVLRFAVRFPVVIVLIVGLFAGGVWLMLHEKTSASIVAGIGGILASVGLTWKTIGGTVGAIGGKLEDELWGAELDAAIADAITLLPTNTRERGGRKQLVEAGSVDAADTQRAPHAELLDPVLDPQQLLAKIDKLKQARDDHSEELTALPQEQQLPQGYFDDLRKQVTTEGADPARVARAAAPSPPGVSAPPNVIYLSRRPAVSQFMSVVTDCFDQELDAPPLERLLHLSDLDQLWLDLTRWTEDLRSRFRQFGPCDIRFLEPKLAQALTDFRGKHAFSTNPQQVRLGDEAKVVIVGDWATGLPQARNVAARIHELLATVPSGLDCHVIHLGDTYYAGLEDECRRRFLDLWPVVPGADVGSWTLAGNHDMYAGGHGYFDVLLADTRFAAQNRCSYFCLSNDDWQILGLDSSYKNPDDADLEDPQGEWLAHRICGANSRGTVLLTHHQPFSAYEEVTSPLGASVAAVLGEDHKLDAWLWGHEHRCASYDATVKSDRTSGYNANARYAAVVGHGGVPNLLAAQTAGANRDIVDWEFDDFYQVGDDRWGLGGFAVLTFSGASLEIQYYDEYGKERRDGGSLGYAPGAASVEQVIAVQDARPVRPPDVLLPGQGVAPRSVAASAS